MTAHLVISNYLVMTYLVISEDQVVMTHWFVSDDLIMTYLSSVEKLTDDANDPNDDKLWPV